ncbi:hypothetical protein ACFFX0_19240 [Citricoccus parietis]|uniref:Uncharacterized protein n=1 Tax=Citricoccus parietis TaxID=592307 RepID=A0ABV5G2R0_9MICC
MESTPPYTRLKSTPARASAPKTRASVAPSSVNEMVKNRPSCWARSSVSSSPVGRLRTTVRTKRLDVAVCGLVKTE